MAKSKNEQKNQPIACDTNIIKTLFSIFWEDISDLSFTIHLPSFFFPLMHAYKWLLTKQVTMLCSSYWKLWVWKTHNKREGNQENVKVRCESENLCTWVERTLGQDLKTSFCFLLTCYLSHDLERINSTLWDSLLFSCSD